MGILADQYYPFDAGPGSNVTESGWRQMFNHVVRSGVLANTLNECRPFGDSTGMQVKVDTGAMFVEGLYAQIDTLKTIPVPVADPSLARVDILVARMDGANNIIELDVVTGIPAAVPAAPAPIQTDILYEMVLATIAVGAAVSTLTAANVVDVRQQAGRPARSRYDFGLAADVANNGTAQKMASLGVYRLSDGAFINTRQSQRMMRQGGVTNIQISNPSTPISNSETGGCNFELFKNDAATGIKVTYTSANRGAVVGGITLSPFTFRVVGGDFLDVRYTSLAMITNPLVAIATIEVEHFA